MYIARDNFSDEKKIINEIIFILFSARLDSEHAARRRYYKTRLRLISAKVNIVFDCLFNNPSLSGKCRNTDGMLNRRTEHFYHTIKGNIITNNVNYHILDH